MPRLTITIPEHDPTSFHFDLERKLLALGREENADVTLDHASISQQHAELMRVDGGFILRDLHSLNGTLLEGKRMMVVDFNNDAHAYIGDVRVDISFSQTERQQLAKESFTSMQTTEDPKEEPPESKPTPVKESLSSSGSSPNQPPKPSLPEPTLPEPSPGNAPTPVSSIHRPTLATPAKESGGFLSFVFRCIIGVGVIFAGMAYRHYEDTKGGNLLMEIREALEQKQSR